MNLAGYNRRIRKLERIVRQQEGKLKPKVKISSFALWVERLPEGTVIPEGSRVVTDFYANHDPLPNGHLSGHRRERITDDPSDNGRTIYPAVEPADPSPDDVEPNPAS